MRPLVVVLLSFILATSYAKSIFDEDEPYEPYERDETYEMDELEKRVVCDPNKPDKYGCDQFKSQGLCNKMAYKKFMSDSCPITCGFCPGLKVKKPKPELVDVNIQECLKAQNKYRARHGAPPLKWDPSLAKEARDYALHLAKIKKMMHDPNNRKEGENLAFSESEKKFTCKDATKMWYDEVKDYNWNNPGFSHGTGHFTQVVWKGSKRIGVGIAKNGFDTFIVGRYFPPGNYMGQFAENVGRRQ